MCPKCSHTYLLLGYQSITLFHFTTWNVLCIHLLFPIRLYKHVILSHYFVALFFVLPPNRHKNEGFGFFLGYVHHRLQVIHSSYLSCTLGQSQQMVHYTEMSVVTSRCIITASSTCFMTFVITVAFT